MKKKTLMQQPFFCFASSVKLYSVHIGCGGRSAGVRGARPNHCGYAMDLHPDRVLIFQRQKRLSSLYSIAAQSWINIFAPADTEKEKKGKVVVVGGGLEVGKQRLTLTLWTLMGKGCFYWSSHPPNCTPMRLLLRIGQGGIIAQGSKLQHQWLKSLRLCWQSAALQIERLLGPSVSACLPKQQLCEVPLRATPWFFHRFHIVFKSFSPSLRYSSCLTPTLSPLASPAAIYVVVSAERRLAPGQEGAPSSWPPPWFWELHWTTPVLLCTDL